MDVTRPRIPPAPPEFASAWLGVSTQFEPTRLIMRFTVKAKLASAFGVVILLSMIAGGVAYLKLNDTVSTAEHLSARAGRLAKVGELQEAVLLQVRAEKNTIL